MPLVVWLEVLVTDHSDAWGVSNLSYRCRVSAGEFEKLS